MATAFWITSNFLKRDGASRAEFAFAAEGIDTVRGLVEAIQSGGIVYGERLLLSAAEEDGTRVIRRRQPFGLTAGGIASVQLFDHKIVEVPPGLGRRPQVEVDGP